MQKYLHRIIWRDDTFEEQVFVKRTFVKLSILGIYKRSTRVTFGGRAWFFAVEAFFLLQISTIVWDLATVLGDIGLFGDNMCILAGLLLMLVKKWHSVAKVDEIAECVEQLQAYHVYYLQKGDRFVRRMRNQNLQERLLLDAAALIATVLGGCLIVNILSQMALQFCLLRMEFETIGTELSLPLDGPLHGDEELRRRIHRMIANHQQLLGFCNRLKRVYEPNIMAQFVCSMLIICLTAFELMFAKGDPMQMIRFGAYMLTAFYQIFIWSFFGNRVTQTSTGISDGTVSCNWTVLDDSLKKDLRLTTMRSQKPFVIDVYRLFPLTYETFIAILSRSYSIFTVLRTMIE
uniref:Odorant receptor n=1 Tax=Anopheles farauti TaxID=69004 RepID=A0A182QEY7_9DIPT